MSGRVELRAVADQEAGLRLDRWFQRHFPELSHGALQKLLRTGQVRIDGRRAEGKDRVEAGQTIRLPPGVTASPLFADGLSITGFVALSEVMTYLSCDNENQTFDTRPSRTFADARQRGEPSSAGRDQPG